MNHASSRQASFAKRIRFAKRFRRTSLSVALLGAFSGGAYALPQDGVVAAGTAAINQSGSTMTITQDSARAILDWQSFGIASGELVQFLQPSSSAVVLNRVLGNNASEIYGQLSANGQVFLTNPNGILFGAGAQVDVGGLVASTLGISNEDFLAGNYAFSGADGGVISNAGTITAQSLVALLAPEVRNDGLIVAQAVGIGAGTGITLDLANGLKLEVTASALNAVIENRTAILADGGTIILTATAQQALLGGMINNTGVLAASSLVDDGGTISLVAGYQSLGGDISADGAQGGAVDIVGRNIDQYGRISARGTAGDGGTVNVQGERLIQTAAGVIDASGKVNGGDVRLALGNDTGGVFLSGTLDANGATGGGGDIAITGADLALVAAQVNANGDTGGGQVRIGGDYQGNNPELANARTTYINSSTRISADAGTAGIGGRVIVWSEENTEFNGNISARGGVTGGDGGFVEVSGRESLAFAGDVDLQAPNGDNGLLLLDPKNITISTAGSIPSFRLLDPNAAAGNSFGGSIATLDSGNVAVTSRYDDFSALNAGAVYLFNGETGALISTLRGSKAGDEVGSGGVTALSNGNYVVSSHLWNDGAIADVGAATWGDGTTGITGIVSASNSLVGSTASDQVGTRITALANGNYVVSSYLWDDGAATNVGAVTWGDGSTGITGVVSTANSLVGSTANDNVGYVGVTALSNGNYVVGNYYWDNGAIADAGAVTWGDGSTGITGAVSAANSLVGSTAGDQVGYVGGITALSNGNYVVRSYLWDNGAVTNAGAVTWGDGTTGITGAVSAANSLVGSTAGDQVGASGVTALSNGNYVVLSANWDEGATADVGAATWGDGTVGITGAVSAANSLVGSTAGDQVGYGGGVTALSNGHYVVRSYLWDNGAVTNAGAVTWGDGSTGITGVVSAANSLVGSTADDRVGAGGVTALANGNYVVSSYQWDDGATADVGAATWGDGTVGITGVVSAANSLVGSTVGDQVGYIGGITGLSNGHYVVSSHLWDDGATADVGAATWGDGSTGITGVVSAANSLIGSTANDRVGSGGTTALANGNYVVSSSTWISGAATNAGAVTWGDGSTGITGVVSAANSLVGSAAGNLVGFGGVTALANGDYVVSSFAWDNGAAADVGAVTWGDGTTGITGAVSAANSLVGSTAGDQLGSGGIAPLANGHILVRSPYVASNAGRLDILDMDGSFTYAQGAGQSLTIHPDALLRILNQGTSIILQASNDITVSDALLANNASGDGGNFTLQAGRSILLNAGIATDNGDLTLIANDLLANGVIDADRDAGAAVITATGQAIDAGTGIVTVDLRSGAGKTNSTSGDINLGAISADTILVTNNGITAGSDVIVNGALTATGTGNALTLAGDNVTNNGGSLAANNGRWLVYVTDTLASDPFASFAYDFKQYNATYGISAVLGSGNGFLLSQAPTVTVSLTGTVSKEYDATTDATLAAGNYALSGVVQGDTVTINNPASGTYDNKNVGTGKTVDVAGVAISSTDNGGRTVYGYQLASSSITGAVGTVTAKAIDATGITAADKTYDATIAATLDSTVAALSGAILGDTVSLDVTAATGTFVDKNVGLNKTVTVNSLALTGVDAGNYTLNTYTTTADISALAIDATGITASDKTYDATVAALLNVGSAGLSGAILGDTVSVDATGATGAFDTKNVGLNKTVTVSGLALAGTDAGNYTLNGGYTTTADINALALDVTGITAADKVYNATTAATLDTTAANISGVLGSEVVTLDATAAAGAFADKNVGVAKTVTVNSLALTGADAGNYTLSTYTTSADITALAIDASGITAGDKVYDATTAATLDTTVAALSGAILGDTVSLDVTSASGAFDTKNVGLNKTVTVSDLALSGTDAGNYTLNAYTTTADISALAIDASGITAVDRVYDATTVATLDTTAAGLAGAIAGDTVSLDVTTATGAFADKNVGLNKTVTVSGIALAGADAGNYTLNAGYTTTADISALAIDATGITAADKMYDGLTTATLDTTAAALAGVLGGDTVTLDVTGATGAFSDDIAGFNKTVSVSGLLLAGLDAGNYLLNPYTTTADIGLVFSLEQSGVEIQRYTNEEAEGWRQRAVTLDDVPALAIDRCGIRTGLSGAGRPPCDKD